MARPYAREKSISSATRRRFRVADRPNPGFAPFADRVLDLVFSGGMKMNVKRKMGHKSKSVKRQSAGRAVLLPAGAARSPEI